MKFLRTITSVMIATTFSLNAFPAWAYDESAKLALSASPAAKAEPAQKSAKAPTDSSIKPKTDASKSESLSTARKTNTNTSRPSHKRHGSKVHTAPTAAAKEEALLKPTAAELASAAKTAPDLEAFLESGKLAEAEHALRVRLLAVPNDDNARFELGMVQFLAGVTGLSQDLYRYGLRNWERRGRGIPILNMPVKENTYPEKISYEKARALIDKLNKRLIQSATTLGTIKDVNVKVPIHFGLISLDLDGDGKLSEGETLWKLYRELTQASRATEEQARQFVINFDRGDVHWLKGYSHLLSGICEIYLAHDSRETFECTGQLFFKRVDSPYKFLTNGKKVFDRFSRDDLDFVDLIALIHLINWNVAEPQRMATALSNFEEVVKQSRISWKFILSETDDDHEWLPNPKQTGVIPDVRVTEDMVKSWGYLMDESERILQGKRLIQFWRDEDGIGVNVRKVFLQPRRLDLILWVQGPAAAPYLEKGPVTEGRSWREWQRSFGNDFPGFAAWFN